MNLHKFYRRINEEYYGGCLPVVSIEWSQDLRDGDLAASHVHGITRCDHPYNPPKVCIGSYIRMNPAIKAFDCVAAMTLIHEMAHISALIADGSRVKHGKAFHAEMSRLARLGAMDGYW